MPKRPSEFGVIISYRELESLLKAAQELPKLKEENAKMKEEILALRMLYSECLERIGELIKQI